METKLLDKEVNRMTKNTCFVPEVRLILESLGEYGSQWAAICSIDPKIGGMPRDSACLSIPV